MTEREQEIQVSLHADKMLRIALDIKENNKLIAEFMELPKVPCNIGTEYGSFTEGYKHPKVNVPILPSGMQYKYSWDWLMPVINKCYQEHMSKHIADAVMTCNIDEAYEVVVEYINEFNKN
jgi:hypothetical protein